MSLGHAYLAVRDIQVGQATDPDAPDFHRGAGGPVVPPSWVSTRHGSSGWFTVVVPDGSRLAVYVANAVGPRILALVVGDQDKLEAIAAGNDEVMPGREAWRRGYDHGGGPIDSGTVLGGAQEATARQMLRAWRWWRCDVIEDDGAPKLGVVRRLSASGVLLPNLNSAALPWDLDASGAEVPAGSAVRRVTRLVRPAFHTSLAGHSGMRATVEDEPDRG